MSNAKFFIAVILVLGAIAAFSQIFVVFFNAKPSESAMTASSIALLPQNIDVEYLNTFSERADKYLSLSVKQFEDGVDPTAPITTVTVTPTVAPNF